MVLGTLQSAFPGAPLFVLRWAAKLITAAEDRLHVRIVTEDEWDDHWSDGYGAGSNNASRW